MPTLYFNTNVFPPNHLINPNSAVKYELRGRLIISFDPSASQLVEEIPVKLHLIGKSRLTL